MSEGETGRYTENLNFHIEPRYAALLREIARDSEASMSALVRRWVKDGLKEEIGRRQYEEFKDDQMTIDDIIDREV